GGSDVDAAVGAGGICVGDSVGGRAAAEADPAEVLAPDKAGEVGGAVAGALGSAVGVAPVHPAAVFLPGVLVDGVDVGLGEGGGCADEAGENGERAFHGDLQSRPRRG